MDQPVDNQTMDLHHNLDHSKELNLSSSPINIDETHLKVIHTEMDYHCHSNTIIKKSSDKVTMYKLTFALILCFVLMILEIAGGILAKSISIQTDAAHMAADVVGLFFSLVALHVSKKGIL